MPRIAREKSPTDIYHITCRGIGKRIIFEDDYDRRFFKTRLRQYLPDSGVKIIAWCLMDNHVHLLLEAELENLSHYMHRLNSSYAAYFNNKYGHVGGVFQNRFSSHAVETETHLLDVVRYIHLNPIELGIFNPADYSWSSYRQYLGEPGFCSIERVQGQYDRESDFVDFHENRIREIYMPYKKNRRSKLSDFEAKKIADSICNGPVSDWICALAGDRRNDAIGYLFDQGLTYRQIQRLTGLGEWAVKKARTATKKRSRRVRRRIIGGN